MISSRRMCRPLPRICGNRVMPQQSQVPSMKGLQRTYIRHIHWPTNVPHLPQIPGFFLLAEAPRLEWYYGNSFKPANRYKSMTSVLHYWLHLCWTCGSRCFTIISRFKTTVRSFPQPGIYSQPDVTSDTPVPSEWSSYLIYSVFLPFLSWVMRAGSVFLSCLHQGTLQGTAPLLF